MARPWGPVQVIAAGHVADASGPRYGYSDPSYIYDAEANKVFAFFVYSKDQGFGGSQFGNDDADRNVISSAVIESSDAGVTWSQPRLITNVTKPGTSKTNPAAGDVRSNFASSGEGIQLKYGPHKGRLIQQYAGDVRQADGSNKIQADSVYSDDHGVTWHKGANVGDRMDENKTVELSDGRVLLNSRDNANRGYRKVAVSTDGGATYGPVSQDTELPDPANNGAIARMFPNAAQGSADAKKLIFTNANSKTGRENVSARVSCDDGATWPGVRTIRPGFSAYSTVTRLADGKFGVLYEGNYTDNMPFATFDDAWLNYVCAPLAVPAVNIAPSATQQVPVTVTNQGSNHAYRCDRNCLHAVGVVCHHGARAQRRPRCVRHRDRCTDRTGGRQWPAQPQRGIHDGGWPGFAVHLHRHHARGSASGPYHHGLGSGT
ncbi:sialidase family protein [Paenarthrobacter ureafaciens]